MTYYLVGGSAYDTVNYFLGTFMDAGGNVADWGTKDFVRGDIEDDDPFWSLGLNTGVNPITRGNKQVEIGLFDNYRIKITTSGIYGWVGPGDDDFDALGGGGGATVINDLTDVVISGTPADNELLAYDTGSSKWINQTGGEAGLSLSGHTHGQLHDESHSLASHSSEAHNELTGYNDETDVKHLTDAQLNALHTIYSLEQHNNSFHSTNFHSESDGTGAVTVHSGVTDAGSGAIITTLERGALHAIVVAGDLNHNDLANIDADDIKHITATQLGALHAIYTDVNAVAAVAAADAYIKLGGDGITAGAYPLAQDATISFDAEQNDTTYSGICIDIDTTGCNNYDLVYVDAADSVAPCDADAIATMPAIGIVVAAGKVLTHGVVKDDDLIKCTTGGAIVYASTTLREVTETKPAGQDDVVQIVGICVGDHTLFVNVSLDFYIHEA